MTRSSAGQLGFVLQLDLPCPRYVFLSMVVRHVERFGNGPIGDLSLVDIDRGRDGREFLGGPFDAT